MIKMFFKFAVAFCRSWWGKHRGYEIMTPQANFFYRQRLCLTCPWRVEDECSVCGCLWLSKAMLSLEECPKKRWYRVWTKRRRPGTLR